MDGEALKAGKARVRKYLIDELNARGMERKRAVKVEDFEKTMDSLAARLAYMDVEQLQALVGGAAHRPRRKSIHHGCVHADCLRCW